MADEQLRAVLLKHGYEGVKSLNPLIHGNLLFMGTNGLPLPRRSEAYRAFEPHHAKQNVLAKVKMGGSTDERSRVVAITNRNKRYLTSMDAREIEYRGIKGALLDYEDMPKHVLLSRARATKGFRKRLLESVLQQAEALRPLQEKQLALCDITPHNLLIRPDGKEMLFSDYDQAQRFGDYVRGSTPGAIPEEYYPERRRPVDAGLDPTMLALSAVDALRSTGQNRHRPWRDIERRLWEGPLEGIDELVEILEAPRLERRRSIFMMAGAVAIAAGYGAIEAISRANDIMANRRADLIVARMPGAAPNERDGLQTELWRAIAPQVGDWVVSDPELMHDPITTVPVHFPPEGTPRKLPASYYGGDFLRLLNAVSKVDERVIPYAQRMAGSLLESMQWLARIGSEAKYSGMHLDNGPILPHAEQQGLEILVERADEISGWAVDVGGQVYVPYLRGKNQQPETPYAADARAIPALITGAQAAGMLGIDRDFTELSERALNTLLQLYTAEGVRRYGNISDGRIVPAGELTADAHADLANAATMVALQSGNERWRVVAEDMVADLIARGDKWGYRSGPEATNIIARAYKDARMLGMEDESWEAIRWLSNRFTRERFVEEELQGFPPHVRIEREKNNVLSGGCERPTNPNLCGVGFIAGEGDLAAGLSYELSLPVEFVSFPGLVDVDSGHGGSPGRPQLAVSPGSATAIPVVTTPPSNNPQTNRIASQTLKDITSYDGKAPYAVKAARRQG